MEILLISSILTKLLMSYMGRWISNSSTEPGLSIGITIVIIHIFGRYPFWKHQLNICANEDAIVGAIGTF